MIYLWIYLHYTCIYKSYFCYTGKNKHTMTIILIENLLIVMIKIHVILIMVVNLHICIDFFFFCWKLCIMV